MKTIEFQIPATSANLGLGFDSMGVAVDLFLTIETVESSEWVFEFVETELDSLPTDATNLVAETAIAVSKQYGVEMPALKVRMASDIPLTRGLGSSSSAIVAGIELANYYGRLALSVDDKLLIASELEGHPDNVGPCITGGVFVGYYSKGKLNYHSFEMNDIGLIISVPPYEISTKVAREAIPASYPKEDAIAQNALNNVMVLSMAKGDYQTMGQLMMQDKFHEPYRQPLIKEFDEVKSTALANGAYATVISGAGPTILTLCHKDEVKVILKALGDISNCEHRVVNVYNYDN